MIDLGLYIGYALFIIAVLLAIVLPLISALKAPATLVRSLIGVGIIVVLFGISYALTGSNVTQSQAALGTTPASSKLIGAGLTMLYLTFFLAVLSLIYSEISKALK